MSDKPPFLPQLRPEDLSQLPSVPASEPGAFAIGYDENNPARAIRVPLSGVPSTADLATKADLVDGKLKDAQVPSNLATKNGEGRNWITAESGDAPVENGANLLAAYAAAKLLGPNGAALSATNRAVVLVPPGKYDLGTTPLTLDAQFVDIVGVSGDPKHVLITSAVTAAGEGTIVQSADDIRVRAVTVQNTADTRVIYDSSDASAYAPQGAYASTVWEDVVFDDNNSSSFSTRLGMDYSGTFVGCVGGDEVFGGYNGTASGTFTDCTGGNDAFGGNGTASGTFTNCTGGDYAFGGGGGSGLASGTFINCTGDLSAFGGEGTASGTFINCTGGEYAFGGNGTADGTFTNCTGGGFSFGGDSGVSGGGNVFSGTADRCTAGGQSFAYNGTFSGVATHCIGGNASFAAAGEDSGVISGATARLAYCRCESGFGARTSGAKALYCLNGDTPVHDV